MKIGVILLNFGEPDEPTMEAVVPFLERIFSLNAPLMGAGTPTREEVAARSRQLAEARAPGLIAEYEALVDGLLPRLGSIDADAALVLLRLPEKIRGFGPVKERAIAAAAASKAELLRKLDGGSAGRAAA